MMFLEDTAYKANYTKAGRINTQDFIVWIKENIYLSYENSPKYYQDHKESYNDKYKKYQEELKNSKNR